MELVDQLVSNLGIDENQARGGAGLILKMAKDKLGNREFSKIADNVPDINDLIDAAPQNGGGGGLMGAVGNLASGLGGGGGSLGSLASLAGGFSSLGVDSGMIVKFVPLILSFVQTKGGDQAKGLLEGVIT